MQNDEPKPTSQVARPLLSTRELMEIFGRSDRTIRNWVTAGHLHPIKVGRSVFFGKQEIDALLGVRVGELKLSDDSVGYLSFVKASSK